MAGKQISARAGRNPRRVSKQNATPVHVRLLGRRDGTAGRRRSAWLPSGNTRRARVHSCAAEEPTSQSEPRAYRLVAAR